MDLIELVLTVCSFAQPAACEEQRLTFVDRGSMVQCMLQAPPLIAQWSEQHPALQVVKWRCRNPKVEGTEL